MSCSAERSFNGLHRLKHHGANNVSVTSHLLSRRICRLCSQQWYRSYHRFLWPSKRQRQLFLLTCFMTSNVGMLSFHIWCNNIGLHDAPFFSTASKTFGLLASIFGQMVHRPHPPPPRQKKVARAPMAQDNQGNVFLLMSVFLLLPLKRSRWEI